MRRTLIWGTLALYPILAIALGIGFSQLLDSLHEFSEGPGTEFLVKYWWALLLGPAVVLSWFFLFHALVNARRLGLRRFAWAIGILVLGPVVIPTYWWVCSDAT